MRTYNRLYLCTLDKAGHANTCDYWYLVRSDGGSLAHTAFHDRQALLCWLKETGVKLSQPLPEHGTVSGQFLTREYRTEMHMDTAEFRALEGVRTLRWSNGRVTLAIITEDADGIRTEHTLNPNVHDRPEFNWQEARAAGF